MFRLTISMRSALSVCVHPSRELARAWLLDFLQTAGQAYHVTEASWTRTRYDVGDTGYAVIEEICTCDHTSDEHDESGCTAVDLDWGRLARCVCRSYEPIPGDPVLFNMSGPT